MLALARKNLPTFIGLVAAVVFAVVDPFHESTAVVET